MERLTEKRGGSRLIRKSTSKFAVRQTMPSACEVTAAAAATR